jgi:hypothetical protein
LKNEGKWADKYDSGAVLEKVCEYLYYNQKHAESKDVPDMEIPPELCLELLLAADYLDGEVVMKDDLEDCANTMYSVRGFRRRRWKRCGV